MNKCQEALNQVTYKFEEADIFPQSTDAACKCQDEDDATKDDHDDGKVKYKVIDLNGLVVIFTVLKRILLKIRPHAHHQECYSNQLEHTMTQHHRYMGHIMMFTQICQCSDCGKAHEVRRPHLLTEKWTLICIAHVVGLQK